eukprot:scaffold676_cov273-Pinguiococcus_pyrenoidosus.AAC.9
MADGLNPLSAASGGEVDGWARGADGALHKKYDPHAANRKELYERRLRQHQKKRQESGSAANNPQLFSSSRAGLGRPHSFSSNQSSSYEDRRRAVAARKEAARQQKIAKARKTSEAITRARERKAAATAGSNMPLDGNGVEGPVADRATQEEGAGATEGLVEATDAVVS